MTTTHRPQIGSLIITDARLANGRAVQPLIRSDWESGFRLDGRSEGLPDFAVDVEVTGRVVRYPSDTGLYAPAVRVRVTFVGDGEPDQVVGGWMIVK